MHLHNTKFGTQTTKLIKKQFNYGDKCVWMKVYTSPVVDGNVDVLLPAGSRFAYCTLTYVYYHQYFWYNNKCLLNLALHAGKCARKQNKIFSLVRGLCMPLSFVLEFSREFPDGIIAFGAK